MKLSYIKIAIRSITLRPWYFVLNIIGLSIGISVACLVGLYTHRELTFDSFHEHASRTYRISGKQSDTWFATLSAPYSNSLFNGSVPEIEKMARVRRSPPRNIRHQNELFYEPAVLFTDVNSNFFDLFDFRAFRGNLAKALEKPNSAVVTRSFAQKIFKRTDVVGELLVMDTLQLHVTSVIDDLPDNTSISFEILIANEKFMRLATGFLTFVRLFPDADPASVAVRTANFKVPTGTFAKLQDCRLISLRDLHFEGNMTYELKPPGDEKYLLIFGGIGFVILCLSLFNFINLSIAAFGQRSKEIAVRRFVGAGSRDLAGQFMIEAVFVCLLCIPVVFTIVELVLPWFNGFMNVRLTNFFATTLAGFGSLLAFIVLLGIITGMYPAIVLPKIKSLISYKARDTGGLESLWLRSVLVGLQITVLVVMLSSSFIIRDQIHFMQSKDLGFNKAGIVKLKGAWSVDSIQFSAIKSRLLLDPNIISVSYGMVPGDEDYGTQFSVPGSETVYSDLTYLVVDQEYISTLGMTELYPGSDSKIGEGRSRMIINETMARRLGIGNAVGSEIVVWPGKEFQRKKMVDGIFKDINFFSLHKAVTPMALVVRRSFGNGIEDNILIRVDTRNLAGAMEVIQKTVKEIVPEIPLTPQLVEESLARFYTRETKLSVFASVLLAIAVSLSMLGLFGLASFMTALRTKEIGIRKVLGASVGQIVRLVSAPFFRNGLFAGTIGAFISIVLARQWIESFAYRIELSWTYQLYGFCGVLAVICMTVLWRAVVASMANPVDSLRMD